MFINQNIVAIAFRLINFAALISIIFFIFKKYKIDLLALISRKETAHHNLLTQQKELEIQQHNLNALAKKEALQCDNFKAKVDEWKKAVVIENNKKEEEHHKLLASVREHHARVTSQKEALRIQNATLTTALITISTSLSDHFKTAQTSTDYLNNIIRFMNERAS